MTRLGEELLEHARSRGAVTAGVRCFEGESSLAYGPTIEMLRSALGQGDLTAVPAGSLPEVSRLLPELGDPSSTSLDSLGAQARFFEALVDALLAAMGSERPGVVFLDDVHWADEASLEVLAYLVRRLEGRPIFILMSWRADEAAAGHPLHQLLTEAARTGFALVVTVSRLTPSDVAELVAAAGASADLAERLHEETGGVPFFVVEYLDALSASGLERDAEWSVPVGVRDLLRSRLSTASEIAAQILTAAAAIGRSFDFETVRDASGRGDEETVAALEELIGKGIVVEQDGSYDFRQRQMRSHVYDETSLARRRIVHRRVAEALATPPQQSRALSSIAEHYRLAGCDADAAEHYRLAGEHDRDLHANTEALAHLRAALAHPDAGPLHEAIGDLLTLAGDYPAALTSYETAAATAGENHIGRLEHKLGVVHERRGEARLAESHFEAAFSALGDSDHAARARVAADRSLSAHRQKRPDVALAHAEEALSLAEYAGDELGLAQAHNMLGILAGGRGDRAGAQRHLEESLRLASESAYPGPRVAALNNLALAYGRDGDLVKALELTREALELCASLGDRHREAALHNNLADLLHAAGQRVEALSHLKEAVTIFAEIGAEDEMEPEIWKLVEW